MIWATAGQEAYWKLQFLKHNKEMQVLLGMSPSTKFILFEQLQRAHEALT